MRLNAARPPVRFRAAMLPNPAPRTSVTGLVDERFLLLEALGRGGMGAVYRAFDRAEQRLVALKVPTEACPAGPAHPLSAEFEAWAGMRHPNIVRAYALGVAATGPLEAGTPYLVLEHVAGGPASRALRAGGVGAALAERMARQVLEALRHVHGCGWLHRDLKPANLLVQGRRRFKLTDFGLAVRVGAAGAAGRVSGSLPYVAPEALLGLPLDERADLYGLGIVLYQLVTGELPARSARARDVLRWHLAGPPADPCRLRPRLPARLGRFIRRLAARDRAARPPDAAEALRLLGGAAGTRPSTGAAHAAGTPQHRASRARLRLALDAARLGAIRVHRLPAAAPVARALIAEASVQAQARGMRYHRVRGPAPAARLALARLALCALCERGADAAAGARRHDLERWLPLRFVGGLPVIDRMRPDPPYAAGAARRIAAFLVDCGRRRPTVLLFERSALREPLVREVARGLLRAARRPSALAPGGGGVLLLLAPEASRSARRRRGGGPGRRC